MRLKTVNIPYAMALALWKRPSVNLLEMIMLYHYRLGQPWYPKIISVEKINKNMLLKNKIERRMLM